MSLDNRFLPRFTTTAIVSFTLFVSAVAQDEGWITHHVEISPDAAMVVHGSMHAERGDSWLIGVNGSDNTEVARVRYYSGPMRDASFSGDGRRLATTTGNGRVRIFDAKTLRLLQEHEGHESWVLSVALSADGSTVASSGRDQMLLVRHADTGRQLQDPIDLADNISALRFMPESDDLLVAQNGSIYIFSNDGKDKQVIADSLPAITDLDVSLDGRRLASIHHDGDLRVWDLVNHRLLFTVPTDDTRLYCVAFSPNGKHVVTSGKSHVVKVWNVEHGSLTDSLVTDRSTIALKWIEQQIVAADYDGLATVWTANRSGANVIEWKLK